MPSHVLFVTPSSTRFSSLIQTRGGRSDEKIAPMSIGGVAVGLTGQRRLTESGGYRKDSGTRGYCFDARGSNS